MADLAQRLDVTGRRIVVLAGPGDRRDEDLVAIANAVAGRFDHYICRRDDNLRERTTDEVPRIQAQALRAAGVSEQAISIIPDEQEAINTALSMGQPGDLLLIFADALARSWKQITKFKPTTAYKSAAAPTAAGTLSPAGVYNSGRAASAGAHLNNPDSPTSTSADAATSPASRLSTPAASAAARFATGAGPATAHFATSAPTTNGPAGNPLTGDSPPMVFNLEGLIRDERGVRLAPEAED
jgi:hypothetical protein